MHHAVSRRIDRREDRVRLKPVQQKTHRCAVIGGVKAAGGLRFFSRIIDDQIRVAQTDAIDLSSSRRRGVSPASYTANRMLDEPLLIVRMQDDADVTDRRLSRRLPLLLQVPIPALHHFIPR
jgi:hypothetical protein